ncbi:inorganic diphosphatase [Candidatus Deianiraea vastatrix]|uniref:Inorganic pyrophosphatase n=1 Tax=Candidatus Deianiraea vastatrix TaxID=2163644 RepID=A0A5B8XEW3_9RICK|nr:inorganic diphosphatase [Candidatus Deianiraea vastatrix]QED23435.1 Inorganic pyrophosphatase [Candidatus Deianiraea vastatrix]
MFLDKIKAGEKVPDEVNVIIEVAAGSAPVKYEFDKDSGAIFVDRFIQTPMFYPANYGFIPHTLADDGDPVDVMVITRYPLAVGCVIPVRPIGLLYMEDESGKDEKIIAVPKAKSDPYYKDINELADLPETFVNQIKHFFERYKDLDAGKWVKISGFGTSKDAKEIISKFILNK